MTEEKRKEKFFFLLAGAIVSKMVILMVFLFLLRNTTDRQNQESRILFLGVMAGYLLLQTFVLFFYARRWLRRFQIILETFEEECGIEFYDGPDSAEKSLTDRLKAVLDYTNSIYQESAMLSVAKKQAEINALQSQINPHFLYNILDSIRGQALEEGVDEIAEMTEALANYFRYCISGDEDIVTLEDELKNVKNYWAIQKYRFTDKISMEILMDKDIVPYACPFPKLVLQPLIENAIYHGLEIKQGKGRVTVRIHQTQARLVITIADDGVGMETKELDALRIRIQNKRQMLREEGEHRRSGAGIALVNVNTRIKLLYGDNYGLQISSAPGIGTEVEVTVPVEARKGM